MGRKKKPSVFAIVFCPGNILDGKRVQVLGRTASDMMRCKMLEEAGAGVYAAGAVVLLGPGELEIQQ